MCVWPCVIGINNVEDQLDATVAIYWSSNQLNMFREFFAHPQERKNVIYSVWYNAPKLLSVGGKDCSPCRRAPDQRPTTIWVHYTTRCKSHSCTPEDGQKIARNMLSWLEDQ